MLNLSSDGLLLADAKKGLAKCVAQCCSRFEEKATLTTTAELFLHTSPLPLLGLSLAVFFELVGSEGFLVFYSTLTLVVKAYLIRRFGFD